MIIQFLPDQVAAHWKVIQYAAIQVQSPKDPALFSRNLLKNLMSGKYQAWAILDENKGIKGIMITRIFTDIGDTKVLLVDVIYGYAMTTPQEKQEAFDQMVKFARNVGCSSIAGCVANDAVARLGALAVGMKEQFKVYAMEV